MDTLCFSVTMDIPLFILGLGYSWLLIDSIYSFVHIEAMDTPGFSLVLDIPVFILGLRILLASLVTMDILLFILGLWILLAS
jgi:hypothetical protein